VAIEVDVQRLQLGDVILIQPPDGAIIEAQVVGESPEVVRELERSEAPSAQGCAWRVATTL